jgi:predicted amidophosphoribosyltransferase
VVPEPLHRGRRWQRGFNQAAPPGREIARARGAKLAVDMLERRKPTPSLGGLGRKARTRALSGAIAVNPKRAEGLRGTNVVLFDDVLTSGVTSKAGVTALRRAGADRFVASCCSPLLDRTLPRG